MLKIGCDICQVGALQQMLKEEPAAVERIFNPEERQYAQSQGRPAEHLAGIFAAKEALAKAVKEPALLGKYYREVTILHEENGTPFLRFSGRLSELFLSGGITVADLSISHDADYAVAAVVVERRQLRCDRCFVSLGGLEEQRAADGLIQIVNKEGAVGYRCPACFRGW